MHVRPCVHKDARSHTTTPFPHHMHYCTPNKVWITSNEFAPCPMRETPHHTTLRTLAALHYIATAHHTQNPVEKWLTSWQTNKARRDAYLEDKIKKEEINTAVVKGRFEEPILQPGGWRAVSVPLRDGDTLCTPWRVVHHV